MPNIEAVKANNEPYERQVEFQVQPSAGAVTDIQIFWDDYDNTVGFSL